MEKYFTGCDICYALHIDYYYRFIEPIKLEVIKSKYKKFVVPQFYRYIKDGEPMHSILDKQTGYRN